eukprot:TRINITY_DN2331_c5_g1_i1.p1 TRINITY_DN2331_c5_g1~~TRINITY_DN2331_c5_g1_i1.p1  ORF type:complete len:548 (+),score=76.72 TRINITY_DN2331_c5_g1_i1:70-1713(+)
MKPRRDHRGGSSMAAPAVLATVVLVIVLILLSGYVLFQKDPEATSDKDWEAETEKIMRKTDTILRKLRKDLQKNADVEDHETEHKQEANEAEEQQEVQEEEEEDQHHPPSDSKYAYVSVISLEGYVDGAIVMGLSLKNTSSFVKAGSCKLVCIVVDTISEESKDRIRASGWIVKEVSPLNVHVPKAHWADSFDKLYVFGLTQFTKIVLVDTDMLAVSDPDAIFQTKLKNASYIGAIGNNPKHHKGPYFQSGMLVVIPSKKVNSDLFNILLSESAPKKPKGIYNRLNARDGVLLRNYFVDRYTTISNVYSKHLAPWEVISPKIKMLHFRGSFKPWSSIDAMFASKPEELAFGPGYRLWWEYYERFHKTEVAPLDDEPTWGANNDKNPKQYVWMMRHTAKAYMRKLTNFRFRELNLSKDGLVLVKGNLGESCDTVCKLRGKMHKWCDETSLTFTPLSECALLKRVFSCSRCSYAEHRKDYPAAEAPSFVEEKDLCLRNYQLDPRIKPACADKHEESRRLCPCFMKGDIDNTAVEWTGDQFEVIDHDVTD